ncbi:hypothetical protein L249_4265 [Ophiocordyceps polyrhachis-furcata BCC 54312]|uniref:Uncharacterized protein n=1 Tax=Ophiocordyceps polyrhachis-furcata BCC 54312 TaxID=1330021 RepID=A0A367L858_9HYPO|nr:hypothetical protein L249_4265 [Ophiocordyceps polyrhachis-furcata BCC 54312]
MQAKVALFFEQGEEYKYNIEYFLNYFDSFLATSLRKILLALYVISTPKAPSIIFLLSKVSNFTNLFSKEKASALLPYYIRKFPPKAYTCK